MADKTGIEWTDATWNPVTGCTKVSPGCDHCYAERVTERFHGKGSFATVQLHPERLDLPLRWRKPKRIFVNSMSDLFHDDVPDDFIAHVFGAMALAQRHTFQVLTKRHGRMRSLLSSVSFVRLVANKAADLANEPPFDPPGPTFLRVLGSFPLPNVWLGVSVETQQWADIRIPALLETPATVRFLSCEPLLGPVDLYRHMPAVDYWDSRETEDWGIGWVIVGGESGPGARPMHPQWARDIRDQCTAAGVPFLFKQWGEYEPAGTHPGPDHHVTLDGRLFRPGERLGMNHMMSPAAIHRWGKKAAGRKLDGRTWDEYPDGVS